MMKTLMVMAAAVGAATTVFGAGVADAEQNLTGMKYSEALSTIQSRGLTAQVSARVGDRLAEGDCIVTGSTKSALPARGFSSQGPSAIVLVSLDCNGLVASATNPGYSAASPEGRAALKEQKKQEWLATAEGQEWCVTTAKQHDDWGLKCG
jgi:hypothetical protein